VRGATGLSGPTGFTGSSGEPGISGQVGATGSAGEIGATGKSAVQSITDRASGRGDVVGSVCLFSLSFDLDILRIHRT